MPNLENLRKQAKQIARWHREGHYPVAAMVRQYLPRFRSMSDAEILAASFKLKDAQELVARQNGLDSWSSLKNRSLKPSPKLELSPSRAKIVTAEPQLFVANIKRSCDFFCEKLGFAVVFSYGKPAFYAQVARDGARVNLRYVETSPFNSEVRDREGLLSASLVVASAEEIKLLFLEFQSAGAPFQQRLKKQPWGATNFIVKDPDGNLLLFAGPAV
jgi:uncharacterized glyoxalase superfamily protein PhnB